MTSVSTPPCCLGSIPLRSIPTELVDRLSAAAAGSRHLDYELKDALNDPHWNLRVPADWTTSLDAALALAERVLPDRPILMDRMPDGSGWAQVRGTLSFNAKAATPALALCIAILKALAPTPSDTLTGHEAEGEVTPSKEPIHE